jgi:hypothetical protein
MNQQDFEGLTDNIHLPVKLVVPEFAISHQVLDPNNNGAIEQGETVDLIVRVRNTGGLDANDVQLKMEFDKKGVVFQGNPTVSIGRIAAGKDSGPLKFQLTVKRLTQAGALPITFSIDQKDFSSKALSLALNVKEEQDEMITVSGQGPVLQMPARIYTATNSAPVIAIGSLMDNQRVVRSAEALIGTVADDSGVASIEVLVNGRKIEGGRNIGIRAKSNGNPKRIPFNYQVPLRIGKNTITVRAYDLENLSSEYAITVHRESDRGEIFAAVIGIDQYQHVPSLRYAQKDAKAFCSYLRNNLGITDDHILELYNQQATASAVRSMLGTKLKQMARKPEDTVFIFYAGHGAPENDPDSRDNDGITKYILTHEANPQDLYSTSIPMDEIARLFGRIRAERLVFISDSCFSGASGGRTILAQGTRAGHLSEGFLERLAKGKGRIILTSSSANEVSEESDKYGHGLFTYYLLKGLRGEANVNGDRYIDVDEISRYLKVNISAETQGRQNPVMKGASEGLVILGRIN